MIHPKGVGWYLGGGRRWGALRRDTGAFTALLFVLLVGCATTAGLRQAPLEEGAQRLFRAPMEEARQAARAALIEAGFEVAEGTEADNGVWVLMARKGMTWTRRGEGVRVALKPDGLDKTIVRVVTKRRFATHNTATGDWSAAVFEAMLARLF